MVSRCSCRLAAATLLMLGSLPVVAADDPPAVTGDLWEITSKMSMEGMPVEMGASKSKYCAPKEWQEPPGGADERRKCTNSDFKMEEGKATWKVTCEGPPAMTGEGEIIMRGTDAWVGAIQFTSEEGDMTIKLSGSRIEDCTPK